MANNQILASDNFASGSLAAGWGTFGGYPEVSVVGGSTQPGGTSANYGQIWTGATWPNSQTCEVTANLTQEASTFLDLGVRLQTGSSLSGYVAVIANGILQVYSYSSGTGTQISSNVSGLTFAAGDVWSFQVDGATLAVYQNGVRKFYAEDTTWTSGYPGYILNTSVNVTHTKVLSFRGYTGVQQDGVWTKYGSVIMPLSSDFSAGSGGPNNASSIIYEGNAQVLSGTVYKMWFANNDNICYAESPDGLNWTRKVGTIISGQNFPTIFKVGATYYLYCQLPGSTCSVYTSTDGVNFSVQNSNMLNVGGVGAWDHQSIWGFAPAYIDANGTWWGLYAGVPTSSPFIGSIGLATSTDGINWSKYAGNPVQANFWNSQALVKVNGVWYMWGASNQPGQGNSVAPGLDPTDTIRMQSIDLITWTNPVHSIHHSQMAAESLNATTGQAFSNSIINIGSRAYMYYSANASDAVSPSPSVIALAIAPAPIAAIITQNEDGVKQAASDAFTSGLGNLSANWTTPTGVAALQIVSGNKTQPGTTGVNCAAAYTGAGVISPNQYSEITIATLSSANNAYAMAIVRCSLVAATWYQYVLTGPTGSPTSVTFYKNIGGVATQLQAVSIPATPQIGDVWRFQVVTGSDGFPILSLFQNGFLMAQVEDYSNAITSGYPGILQSAATTANHTQVSSWAGGNANVTPAYPSGGSSSWLTVAQANGLRGIRH